MKKVLIICVAFVITNTAQAQLLKKLKDKAEKALEKKPEPAKPAEPTTKPVAESKSTTGKPVATKPAATTTGKKLTSEEKETAQLYAPTPYRKYTGEVPNPNGAVWPNAQYSFFDSNNDGLGYFVEEGATIGKGVNAMSSVHYYKVDKNLKATPYLSFEVGKYEEGDNSKYNLLKNGFVKTDGTILSFGGQRNGTLLYQITPDGVRTTLAGNSFNKEELKDGKGPEASIGGSQFIKELSDGSVLFTDNTTWRMITPEHEIKTVIDSKGNPIKKRFFSNIIADKNGYWYYSNDYEIVKFKPGLVVDSFISVAKSVYKNNENSEYELSKTAGKQKWVMGKLGVASFPGIANIAWGPAGEIYFYSTAADRFAVIKNGAVSHFCGNSDFKAWYSGNSLGAQCGGNGFDNTYEEKDGSATTAVICSIKSMKWIGEHLVVLRKDNVPDPNSKGYFLPSFKLTKIDKAGNAKSLPTAQNL